MWQIEKAQCFKEIIDILKKTNVLFLAYFLLKKNNFDLNFLDNNQFFFSLLFVSFNIKICKQRRKFTT